MIKPKRCRVCKTVFPPISSLSVVCSWQCALAQQDAIKERKARKRYKEGIESLKTPRDALNEAEVAFRRKIRARDRLYYYERGQLPTCISCGTQNPLIQYAAGHFKTKGAFPELRLDEKNCYLQCNNRCNKNLSGNINGTGDTHGYIEGLKIRFGEEGGQEILDYLNTKHPAKKYTVDDLKELKKQFNTDALKLEKKLKQYL